MEGDEVNENRFAILVVYAYIYTKILVQVIHFAF